MSAKDALMNFSKKQIKSNEVILRKSNDKPEQDVEKACMPWFKSTGFSMNVVESKAVWNNKARRYLSGQTVSGFTDSAGCTPSGIGSFVEFKAKGKRSSLKEHQRKFIHEKIIKGCFSCVVDSVECLEKTYQMWNLFMLDGERSQSIAYLLSILPEKKTRVDKDLDL